MEYTWSIRGIVYIVLIAIAGAIVLTLFASGTPQPTSKILSNGMIVSAYRGVVIAWSPDSTHIAIGLSDGTVHEWDTYAEEHILRYYSSSGSVTALAWSPDGTYIASGYDNGTIQIWEAATGKNLLTYHGHTKEVFAQAWSPDSTRIISVSEDQTAQIWNALTGQPLFVVHHGFSWLGAHVSWSRGGRYVTIADNDWQILDGISGRVVYHSNALGVSDGAWAPDGKHIALVFDSGAFLAVGAVAGQDTIYFSREARDSIYTLSWSPDSKYIAAGTSSGLIEIWDAHTAKLVFSYEPYCMFMEVVAWSSDGKHIASVGLGDSNIQIWQI